MPESIPYLPTAAVSYDPAEPVYWEREALDAELRRTAATVSTAAGIRARRIGLRS